MVPMIILSVITISVALAVHMFNISYLIDVWHRKIPNRYLVLNAAIVTAIVSQAANAAVFCLAYLIGIELQLGDFKEAVSVKDIFYFSFTTITTLGLGTVLPTGDLRMLAGVEAATGFFLITCSASKFYQLLTERTT